MHISFYRSNVSIQIFGFKSLFFFSFSTTDHENRIWKTTRPFLNQYLSCAVMSPKGFQSFRSSLRLTFSLGYFIHLQMKSEQPQCRNPAVLGCVLGHRPESIPSDGCSRLETGWHFQLSWRFLSLQFRFLLSLSYLEMCYERRSAQISHPIEVSLSFPTWRGSCTLQWSKQRGITSNKVAQSPQCWCTFVQTMQVLHHAMLGC